MVNIVHQRTLLFFYIVAFALVLAAICGKSWIIDERLDITGLIGAKDERYVAYVSLWHYYDWKDNRFDIQDLYNNCDFRMHGFQVTRGFLIMALVTIVAQFAVFLFSIVDRVKNARKQLMYLRVVQALHIWSTFCVFITFTIFAGIVEKECNGIEISGRNFNYGWCFAFVVSIFVLFGFQLIALVLTPTTYFRCGKKYPMPATPTNAPSTTEQSNERSGAAILREDERSTPAQAPVNAPPAGSGSWIPVGNTPPEAPSATPKPENGAKTESSAIVTASGGALPL